MNIQDHILAIQIRTNTYNTRKVAFRRGKETSVLCRKCSRGQRVLSFCPSLKWQRIMRHDFIKLYIAKKLRASGWAVDLKRTFNIDGKVLQTL